MRVLVFGATGRTGSSVVEQALVAGHDVTAFVRDASKLKVGAGKVRIALGDIYKPQTLRTAFNDKPDAVIVTVGADPLKPSHLVTDSAKAIVATMKQTGVSRYLGITGTAQMPKSFFGTISIAILRLTPVRHAARDHDGAFAAVRDSGLTWTLAGCPWIKDMPTQPFITSNAFPGGMKTISPQNVATFLVQELTSAAHPNQIVGIWHRD